MTQFFTRRALAEGVRRLRAHPSVPDERLSVLFLDVDHLKDVNDTHGHAAGDELLVEIARRICGCVRTGDLVARLGGDEFVVVLETNRPSPDGDLHP